MSEFYEIEFSPAEYAMLKEEKYNMDHQGRAETQSNNFQKFVPNLRFAFNCFAKAHGLSEVLDISNTPLKEFEKLRNRITHPKQLSDLTISDEEIKNTEKVANWYSSAFIDLVKKATTSLPALPVRPVHPSSGRLAITKDFFVMQPDGNVYQFDSLEDAQEYISAKSPKDGSLGPVLVRTEDLPDA